MTWKHRFHSIVTCASIAILMAYGCATTPYWTTTSYGTMTYSQAELEKLPHISIKNILSSGSADDQIRVEIIVRSRELKSPAKVKRLAGQKDVIVTDAYGQEVQIEIDQITEIERIRRFKVVPRKTTMGEKADTAGEVLIYAPLIPVAIASWPILRMFGLDAVKNDDDKEKALLAYGGMSKEDLTMYVGEPKEKYYCKNKYGDQEIWIYEKSQVLRGGRALFIYLDDGVVYHTSHDTTFFKDSNSLNCSVLRR